MIESKSDKWLDYLTAYGFDTTAICNNIIARGRRDPRKLIDELIGKSQRVLQLDPKVKYLLDTASPYQRIEKTIKMLIETENISQPHCELFLNRYLWVNYRQDQLFDYLERQRIKLQVKFTRGHYELIVFATEAMRENFKRFGDVVHVTFNFVPVKRNPLMRAQYLGIFSGAGLNGDMIIFGMALAVGSDPQLKAEAIERFLNIVKPYRPLTVIGEHCSRMKLAIKKFNKRNSTKIYYFQNWQHVLQRAQKEFQTQLDQKQLMMAMKKLLTACDKGLFHQILSSINQMIQDRNRKEFILSLLKDTMSYCSAQPPSFVGFEIKASHYNTISDIVKQQFGYCQSLGILFYHCLQFQRKINISACQDKRVQNVDKFVSKFGRVKINQDLKMIGSSMSSEIFRKLLNNYMIATRKCEIAESKESPLKIIVREVEALKDSPETSISDEKSMNPMDLSCQSFQLKYNLADECWQCECKMIYWSGIPCPHIIRALSHYGGSIQYYLNSRWIKKTLKSPEKQQIQMRQDPQFN